MTSEQLKKKLASIKYPERLYFSNGWNILDEDEKSMFSKGYEIRDNMQKPAELNYIAVISHVKSLGKRTITIFRTNMGTEMLPQVAKLYEFPPKDGAAQSDGWRIRDGRKHKYFRCAFNYEADPTKEHVVHGNLAYGTNNILSIFFAVYTKQERTKKELVKEEVT